MKTQKQKAKPKGKQISLTLTREQFAEIHDMFYSLSASFARKPVDMPALRNSLTPLEVEYHARLMRAIKEASNGIGGNYHITVQETFEVLSRVSWLVYQAAGCNLKYINSEVLGNINNQLMRKAEIK